MRVLLLGLLVILVAADVSGTWVGTIQNPGADNGRGAKLILHLTQRDDAISGTAGNDDAHQTAIRNGRVRGDSLEFDVQWGNTAHFALALHGDELAGEMRGDPKEAPPGKHPALLVVSVKRASRSP